MKTCRTKK